MEPKQNNLDKFVRDNLSDFTLSENRVNRELLNHLLNEKVRKKKNRKLILFFFSFFIILSTGLFIFLPSKQNKEKEIAASANSNSTTKSPSAFQSSENKNSQPAISNQSEKNENDKINENNNQSTSHSTTPSRSEETKTKQNSTPSVIKHSVATSNTKTVQAINTNPQINFAQQSNIAGHDSDKTVLLETEISKSVFTDLPITKSNDSIPVNTTTQETANENSISPDSINTKTTYDSLIVTLKNSSTVDSATQKIVPVNAKFLHYNFYAGVNFYSTGNAISSNQEHISPLAGFEFLHSFSSHFNVGLGGLYSLQGGYHLADTTSQESYFLDHNSEQRIQIQRQTIQIRKLHKLYFPLTIYYAIGTKHTLSAGVQWSYLVNTIGDFTQTNTASGITITNSNKNNVIGYMDGIKSTNVSVSLGYKFSLSEKFDWTIRVTRELSDTYINEYFSGIESKPSFSFQTFLIVKF
ncbi:MAG: hypothetical protein ABIT08_09500 [Bacteroidia bacterium]